MHNQVIVSSSHDVFIAIPFASKNLGAIKKQLVALQKQIQDKAAEQGFFLDTDVMPPDKLHITVEAVKDVTDQDVESYKKCTQHVASTSEAFDICSQIRCGKLEIMGKDRDWCVLKIASSCKTPLMQLNQRMRWNFEQENLAIGQFTKFNAHISLGRFTKNDTHEKPTDLKWASSCRFVHVNGDCRIKRVMLSVRDRLKESGKVRLVPSTTESLLFKNEVDTPATPALKSTTPNLTQSNTDGSKKD